MRVPGRADPGAEAAPSEPRLEGAREPHEAAPVTGAPPAGEPAGAAVTGADGASANSTSSGLGRPGGRVHLFPATEAQAPQEPQVPWRPPITREQLSTELARMLATQGTGAVDDIFYLAQREAQDRDFTREWESPIPLSTLNQLPDFPVEALPKPLADYVREVALTRQVSVDLPAMLGLAAVAACAARRFEVQVGAMVEPLCLWTIVGAQPGERKSSVFGDMIFPLREIERELVDAAQDEVAKARQLHEVHEAKLKKIRGRLAKTDCVDDVEEIRAELDRAMLDAPEVPALPRLTVDDVTQERLAALLAENDGCIALLSSEGGVFGMMGGRYNDKGGPNLDVYLKGHAGDSIRVDRADGRALYVPRTALTLGLTVQPELIRNLGSNPAFRHRGLPARGLYALPRSLMGTRLSQQRVISEVTKQSYGDTVRRMLQMPPLPSEDGSLGRHRLQIVGDAYRAYAAQADLVEMALGPHGALHGIRDWGSKFSAQIARIAAIFHLLEYGSRATDIVTVEVGQVQAAWRLAPYFQTHALAAFDLMDQGSEYQQAERILAWIGRHGRHSFSRAECYQDVRRSGGVNRPEDVTTPLQILEAHRYIVERTPILARGPGRPRSSVYDVNPAVHVGPVAQGF